MTQDFSLAPIDKNNSTPIYIQLKGVLKNAIMTGEIGESEMIPSESQLAKKYDITRTTVRRALSELVNESILRKEHGRGTFVSLKPISYSMWNFSGFTEYASKRDKTPVSKVIKAEKVLLNGREFFILERARGVKEQDQVLYLTLDHSEIPLDIFPGIDKFDFATHSLYKTMRHEYGVHPDRVELSMNPVMADEKAQKVFTLTGNDPLLQSKGQVYCKDNRLIEIIRVIYGPNVDFKLLSRFNHAA
jgi:DNA-binding GntR family transcriptional regulator